MTTTITVPEWGLLPRLREMTRDYINECTEHAPGLVSVMDQHGTTLMNILRSTGFLDPENPEHIKLVWAMWSMFIDYCEPMILAECDDPADPIHHLERAIVFASIAFHQQLNTLGDRCD